MMWQIVILSARRREESVPLLARIGRNDGFFGRLRLPQNDNMFDPVP